MWERICCAELRGADTEQGEFGGVGDVVALHEYSGQVFVAPAAAPVWGESADAVVIGLAVAGALVGVGQWRDGAESASARVAGLGIFNRIAGGANGSIPGRVELPDPGGGIGAIIRRVTA